MAHSAFVGVGSTRPHAERPSGHGKPEGKGPDAFAELLSEAEGGSKQQESAPARSFVRPHRSQLPEPQNIVETKPEDSSPASTVAPSEVIAGAPGAASGTEVRAVEVPTADVSNAAVVALTAAPATNPAQDPVVAATQPETASAPPAAGQPEWPTAQDEAAAAITGSAGPQQTAAPQVPLVPAIAATPIAPVTPAGDATASAVSEIANASGTTAPSPEISATTPKLETVIAREVGAGPAAPPANAPNTRKSGKSADLSDLPPKVPPTAAKPAEATLAEPVGQKDVAAAAPPAAQTPSSQFAAAMHANPNPAQPAVQAAAPADVPLPASAQTDQGVPVTGLAVEIAARAAEGKRRFEVRLDPPELGRIDVRLDIARDGQVTSRLVVEKAETLDLLRRDSQSLQQTLQSAGLRTDGGGLQFSLRDQPGGHTPLWQSDPAKILIVPAADIDVQEAVRRGYGALRGLGRGLDIRV